MTSQIQWDDLSPNQKRSHKRDRGPALQSGAPIREFAQNTVHSADGNTVWHTSRPDNVEDIVDPLTIPEGHPSAFVPDENTPLALFGALMTDSMLEDVVKFTNMKIEFCRRSIGPANHRSSTYQLIDLMDLKAIIGMLIFSGSKKNSHVRTLDMFSTWSG